LPVPRRVGQLINLPVTFLRDAEIAQKNRSPQHFNARRQDDATFVGPMARGRGNAMNKIREYREQELRCRQRAMYDPAQSWKWLAEAEMWEHKAHQYRASQLEQASAANSDDKSAPSVAA
jgi:hypothetical protein